LVFILSPVFNDWESYGRLIEQSRNVLGKLDVPYKFVAVDDCSNELAGRHSLKGNPQLEIIELARNLGHQKAIVIGLAYIYENFPDADVIVMDSDGEDKPEHLADLFHSGVKSGTIVFAKRTQRSEGRVFISFYKVYKKIFYWLTGHVIDFGNFSFIPHAYLKKVVSLSEIWNHYSVGILRTKLPFIKIPLARGMRYEGKSKMNFHHLVVHGLSAISVYSDIVATRFLIFSISSIVLALISILAIIGIRVFTELAIPGWATNMILGLIVIIFQAFFMAFFMAFSILSNRSQVTFLPYKDYHNYINIIIK
jgi:hypothetical protein